MTDNERIHGVGNPAFTVRVLENLAEFMDTEMVQNANWFCEYDRHALRDVVVYVQQLNQANKTIAELREAVTTLQSYADHSMFCEWRSMGECDCGYTEAVKALTVSKQEESTVSEVACEQQGKDSLNVARQNNPTHSTQQINRLAAEVESDMQWRGEPT